ncbi:MAG: hypothetical protein Hyperionvirus14_48 [Hyperionvirus sp.]|uniref:DUF72 domain-containing protein n=1 Tax=Hyperionvirus sp. TaxID=2487770 RepID=A0A3G5AF11_9VIRU|nr:MAG: hypothetical protein Hyperionvirus14_48 [Hyperionvirus sp.]
MDELYRGIIIVYPHGGYIADGSKKVIVKSKRFGDVIGKPLLLIEGKKALGVIYLNSVREITLEEFRRRSREHRITEEERVKWWPGKRILYEYPVSIGEIFMASVPIDYGTGPQVFVKMSRIKLLQRVYIGTSGYSYKGDGWDNFYSGADAFEVYADNFNTVELNVTFYRSYSAAQWRNLAKTAPKDFVYSIKVSRSITHFYQFQKFSRFASDASELPNRNRGPFLFQFAKNFKYTDDNMKRLGSLDGHYRMAFEFRDSGWFNDDVYALFKRKKKWSMVISYVDKDTEWNLDPGFNPKLKEWVQTADFVYVRLHGTTGQYTGSHKRILPALIKFVRELNVRDIFVYFNNTDSGQRLPDAIVDAEYMQDKIVLL